MGCASLLHAQDVLPEADKSPLDVSYFPVNYPIEKVQTNKKEAPVARVIYSRPKKEGRPIFGNLVEYGKLWRLGANEATEVEFFKPVVLGGKKLAKGRYTMYAVVNEKSWTVIFNKETDIWGSFKYSPSKDALRVEAAVEKTEDSIDLLSLYFEKTTKGAALSIQWEQTKVSVPFTYQ